MNTAELRKQLEDALASHQKAIENVRNFEAKLAEARRAEAVALTDDSMDEANRAGV